MSDTRNAYLIRWLPFIRTLARRSSPYAGTEDFEDLRQEIALAALEEYGNYDPARGEYSTWLGLVARHAASRQVVITARRKRTRVTADGGESLDELGDHREPDPADAAAARELAARVRAAVAGLDPRLRKAVTRRFGLDGRGERTLARIEPGVSISRNGQLVAKGLQMVRAELDRRPQHRSR